MQRCLVSIVVLASMTMAIGSAVAQSGPATCPPDVRAALDQACACGSFKHHGQYMKCVQKAANALRQQGCTDQVLAQAVRCAAGSTCGKPHNLVVCCNKHGRAKLTSAATCMSKGGTVKTGVTSLCDAACAAP